MKIQEARFFQVVSVPLGKASRQAVTHVTDKHYDLWFEYPFLRVKSRESEHVTLATVFNICYLVEAPHEQAPSESDTSRTKRPAKKPSAVAEHQL